METINLPKAISTIAALLMFMAAFAQGNYEGDGLTSYIGKKAESEEVKNLQDKYHGNMANDSHYLSSEGIELIFKNGLLNEINLFKTSPVYGSFKGRLPKGVAFGMSSSEVKAKLGKPTLAYNSGYCEFNVNGNIVSCWFENGGLNQLGISAQ